MPVVGRCDDDRLDGVVLKDASHVRFDATPPARILQQPLGRLLGTVSIRIHHCADLDAGDPGKQPHQLAAAAAHADHG